MRAVKQRDNIGDGDHPSSEGEAGSFTVGKGNSNTKRFRKEAQRWSLL